MSAQNGEKKLSMSLDDIIKMNRKQNQRTGGGGGGNNNNNNNRRNNNFAGGNNNNRRFNNNNRRQGGGGGGPRNNNNNNRPKFGMLNRSKTIGKNNRIGGGRPNNVGGGNRFNNGPKRQNNRPRFQNQANRFNNRPQIQQQPQQQQPKPQQPRPQQPRPQQPRQQNRAVGGGIANKLAQRIRQQRAGNKLGRVGGAASRGLARLNTFRSNKIAMQAARKNVQKAKRLLTTNRRTQQIKPRRFQNPGNPNAQNKVRLAGRRLPNKTANGDNRLNAIRKQIQRQKIQQRQQKIRTNRPILNRNRGNNRMVMG